MFAKMPRQRRRVLASLSYAAVAPRAGVEEEASPLSRVVWTAPPASARAGYPQATSASPPAARRSRTAVAKEASYAKLVWTHHRSAACGRSAAGRPGPARGGRGAPGEDPGDRR